MFAVAIMAVSRLAAAAQQAKNAQPAAGQAMGAGPGPTAKPIHRLQKPADPVEPVPVSVKPSRQLTD